MTPQILPQEVSISSSEILALTLDFDLVRKVRMGQIQLALRIEGVDSPYPLESHEGLYNLGFFNSFLQIGEKTEVEGHFSSQGFNYGQFLKEAANFEDLKQQGYANNMNPVFFDYFSPRFFGIKTGETNTQRTVLYKVTTYVKDSITGEPVALQPFKIRNLNSNTEQSSFSDENGRLVWKDELSHFYYYPEQYFFPEFQITQETSGYSFTQALAINPWVFGWTFGVDMRGQESYFKEIAARRAIASELMVEAFRYQTIRLRYSIDDYLTLNVKKSFVMAIDPLVERNTIDDGLKFEPLRNGIYLLKVALVNYYFDPLQNKTRLVKVDLETKDLMSQVQSKNCYLDELKDSQSLSNQSAELSLIDETPQEDDSQIGYRLETVSCNGEARKGHFSSIVKKLVRVQAGRITTPLEFSIRDLRIMSVRSHILVQLETIDENRLLSDNLMNAKLSALVEDYYDLKAQGMSEAQKEVFFDEKLKLHTSEAQNLQRSLVAEIGQLRQQREALSLEYEERDQVLSRFENRLDPAQMTEKNEIYRAIFDLSEKNFNARIERARSELNQFHAKIESYWSGYENKWREAQLRTQKARGVTEALDLQRQPTYYDYLATMQHFLDDFDLGLSVIQSDLEALDMNNYAETSLTPLVDLNLYLDESGLKKRTFVGPFTLVDNDNMAEMRPTDKIDEPFGPRIDNSQPVFEPQRPQTDNTEFEQSAYHGSLTPFKDVHVDQLIPVHIENERQYEREMKVLSHIGRFVSSYNLEYVSMTDEPLRDFVPLCNLEINFEDCFVAQTENVTTIDFFLRALNKINEVDLVGRYFHVRPPDRSRKLNKFISRENTLEPLWDRTLREIQDFLPQEEDDWLNRTYTSTDAERESSPFAAVSQTRLHDQAREYLATQKAAGSSQVNQSHLKRWLDKGPQNLTLVEALKICSALTQQITETLSRKNLLSNESSQISNAYLLEYCFSKIHHFDQQSLTNGGLRLRSQERDTTIAADRVFLDGIDLDRRRRVIRTGAHEHIAGKNVNLNVGVSFTVGSYDDTNTAASLGLDGAGLLGIPAAGAGAYIGAAFSGPLAPLGAVSGAALGAIAGTLIGNERYEKKYGVELATSTHVRAATFLVVQKAEEDIVLEEYERCLSFQFSPEAIEGIHLDRLQLSEGLDLKDLGLRQALGRGYLICEGESNNPPVKVRENYYHVTQHFIAGDMLDEINLLNNVWLLTLRGERDFNTFIKTIEGREIGKDGELIKEDRLYHYALYRLSLNYGRTLPSFPGMYSVQDLIPIHAGEPVPYRF